MSEAIGLSGDFAPAFAALCASIGGGGGDFGVSMSLDSGGSFDVGGGGEGGAAPAMEP